MGTGGLGTGPGVHPSPRPLQIVDGDGDDPADSGKSGTGMGMTPLTPSRILRPPPPRLPVANPARLPPPGAAAAGGTRTSAVTRTTPPILASRGWDPRARPLPPGPPRQTRNPHFPFPRFPISSLPGNGEGIPDSRLGRNRETGNPRFLIQPGTGIGVRIGRKSGNRGYPSV